MSSELFAQITESIVNTDAASVLSLTRLALEAGLEPMAVINQGLMPGMRIVGDKFAEGEYFLPHVITAGACMKKAMALLEPQLQARQQAVHTSGTVVIGSVKGDIHEIGKSIVSIMLSANGFQVHDLGVNVPTEAFIAKVQETGANLVGLSALLTTTMTVQREVIKALADAGLQGRAKVIVGGAPVTRRWAEEIGADGYGEDAMAAVRVAKSLVA